MRDLTGLAVIALALVGCGQSLGDIGYPPLPGPAPDTEVVAVSSAIASVDHPVFYRDPDNANRLIAYDLDGMRRGAIDVTASEPYGVYPTADGRMLLLTHAHVVSGGQPVGKVANGTWAGDNRHLCVFLNQLGGPGMPRTRQIGPNSYQGINTPGTLFYQSVGGPSRRVVDYGAFGPHGGPAILACSARTDRAVIVQTFVASQPDLEVIRLSDGQLISHGIAARSASQPDGLVASVDGTLLGEGSSASGWNPGGENSFVVRRLPDGQVLAHITGSGIEAFSADDSKVLVVQYQNGGSQSGRYQTIDLATLRSTWSAVLTPGTVRTRPGTGDFLVASRSWELSKTRANRSDPFEDVWLVPANGPARLLLQHVPPLE